MAINLDKTDAGFDDNCLLLLITKQKKNRPGAGFRPPPLVRPGTAVATPPQQLPPQQPTVAAAAPRPAVPRPLSNSKFVCGVKGTHRELRDLSHYATSTCSSINYVLRQVCNNYLY